MTDERNVDMEERSFYRTQAQMTVLSLIKRVFLLDKQAVPELTGIFLGTDTLTGVRNVCLLVSLPLFPHIL